MKIALCITHADFDVRRQASMDRLRKQLQLGDIVLDQDEGKHGHATVPCFGRIPYREQTGRAPHHVWSEEQWEWGVTLWPNSWVIYLQDDTIVAPDFWERVEKLLRSFVQDYEKRCWINLLTNHWGSRGVFLDGHAAYTTVDGLVGNGYIAHTSELQNLLTWRDQEIMPGMAERISEDILVALYCLDKERAVYTPLPGLIDHDLDVGTLHAQEHMANRRAYVRWDDVDRFLGPNGQHDRVAFLGRFYETAHTMLPGVLTDALRGVKLARKYELDRCPTKYGQLFEMILPMKEWP